MIEVLHFKSISPLLKDDVFIFLYLILMYSGLWMCDVVKRDIDIVHSKLYYELLCFKKGGEYRGSRVPYKTNCKP